MKQAQGKTIFHTWQFVAGAALAVLAGLGLRTYQGALPGTATPTVSASYQTSPVRRGNIAATISGSGKLIYPQSVDLGFAAPGEVAQVNVQVGDQVSAGQVLAVQGHLDQFQAAVSAQQTALLTAQKALDTLLDSRDANVAQAEASQASAQAALAQAQANVHDPGDPRCDAATTQKYYFDYLYAKERADRWQNYLDDGNTGYGRDYILQQLNPLKRAASLAYYNWQYCQTYTSLESLASKANLAVAQANLSQAQSVYQSLKANQGVNPADLAIAQATIQSDRLLLENAQRNLAGATITAPAAGTVTAVAGAAGQKVTAGTKFITLTTFEQPQVQVSIDETDLGGFAAGCPAQVTFTALPGKTFSGSVAQVMPALVTANNVSSAQGLVALGGKNLPSAPALPIGMNASVTITCSQASNVLLAPAQAVYHPAGQPEYVYVLNAQGKPEKRPVVVGQTTATVAEIRSGLQAGEEVITTPIHQPVN